MKVVHVIRTMEFGGIERLVLDLCRAQLRRGLDASVLTGSRHGQMVGLFQAAGIAIIDAGLSSGFDTGWLKTARFTPLLRSVDVIHAHVFNPAMAGWIKSAGTPVVYTEHGILGFGKKQTWRDRVKYRMRARFLKKYVDYITFNSCFTRKVAEKYFDMAAVPRSVVYNGIDFDRYDRVLAACLDSSSANTGRPFVIGTASRFAGFKRIDRLIKAFAGMRHRRHCRLLLVGDGPLRQSYVTLADALGIAGQVEFTGYREDVQNYQCKMDVCVCPSCSEPFGLAALETLALGKTTLVMRDGGGIVEIVEPVELENVVSDIAALSHRLDECFSLWRNNPGEDAKRDKRMTHARSFSIDRMARDFDPIYSSVVQPAFASERNAEA